MAKTSFSSAGIWTGLNLQDSQPVYELQSVRWFFGHCKRDYVPYDAEDASKSDKSSADTDPSVIGDNYKEAECDAFFWISLAGLFGSRGFCYFCLHSEISVKFSHS
jgi:hypothetical protein